jgi:hypothetical protein
LHRITLGGSVAAIRCISPSSAKYTCGLPKPRTSPLGTFLGDDDPVAGLQMPDPVAAGHVASGGRSRITSGALASSIDFEAETIERVR